MQRVFDRLFHKAAGRLAEIGVTFDRLILSDGFPAACAWALTHWCRDITARGSESVPQSGPLLVISNHAGAYDSVVIAARLGRNDLKFITSDIAFLKNLPATREHFFFVSENDAYNRMAAARSGIRHLQAGGALLLFGTGPDRPRPGGVPWRREGNRELVAFDRPVPAAGAGCKRGGDHRQRYCLSQVGSPSGHLAETNCLAEAPPG
jgi:hypothetical protein